jgi:hypothetical protein
VQLQLRVYAALQRLRPTPGIEGGHDRAHEQDEEDIHEPGLVLALPEVRPSVNPKSLSNLDNEHSAFINDVIKSVDAENEAPLVLI